MISPDSSSSASSHQVAAEDSIAPRMALKKPAPPPLSNLYLPSATLDMSAPPPEAAHTAVQPVSLDKRVRLAEDKLARLVANEEQRFGLIQESSTRLTDDIFVLKQQRERWISVRNGILGELRDALHSKLNGIIKDRQVGGEKLVEKVGIDWKRLVEEISEMKSVREDSQTKCARKIGEDVAKIAAEFEKTKELRNAQGERIANTIYEELRNVHNELNALREARSTGENEMLRTVEEMCLRIRGEINNERILREHGEEQLLQLLEETCARVEANFQVLSVSKVAAAAVAFD